jgi:type VI secretion system secreted protein Hcp
MAGLDIFLKIDGIEGEAQDSKHKGEVQVLTFSKGVMTGDARSSGAAAIWHDASFTMRVNKAGPKLMLACANSERIPKVVMTVRKAGMDQREFLKTTFSDVFVSSVRTYASKDSDSTPIMLFTLNFARVEEEYKAQKADGTLRGAMKYSFSIPTEKGE